MLAGARSTQAALVKSAPPLHVLAPRLASTSTSPSKGKPTRDAPPPPGARFQRPPPRGPPPRGLPPLPGRLQAPPELKAKINRFTSLSTDVRPSQPPYHVGLKVRELSGKGELQKAIKMVEDAPLSSQNTALWNILVKEAFVHGKRNLAYCLYIDMKRRAFVPNAHTYAILLGQYSKAEGELSSKQMDYVHSIYEKYMEYMRSLSPDALEKAVGMLEQIRASPVDYYLDILGQARQYQQMFDTYYAMDESGPLAPTQYTFTRMMSAIGRRRRLEAAPVDPTSDVEPIAKLPTNVYHQNASDVKLLWREMIRASKRNGFPIDAHAVSAALQALVKGRPIDQAFAFGIVYEYLGLHKPGDEPMEAKVPMGPHLIDAALSLCLEMRKYRLCLTYAQQIMDSPQMRTHVNRNHMLPILYAHQGLASLGSHNESERAVEMVRWMLSEAGKRPEMIPNLLTYHVALAVCRNAADWKNSCALLELMTGQDIAAMCPTAEKAEAPAREDGDEGEEPKKKTNRPPSERDPLLPGTTVMSVLVQTALATKDHTIMHHFLRIFDAFGWSKYLIPPDVIPRCPPTHSTRQKAFHFHRLLQGLDELLPIMLNKHHVQGEERQRCRELLRGVKIGLQTSGARASGAEAYKPWDLLTDEMDGVMGAQPEDQEKRIEYELARASSASRSVTR
ncbi:hypothetical protein BOTBODRAFT_158220 [Botryobasidium botryosum FD-172 SS1]|uniref:Pentacotripeptide-repeat region of PRORP domain-containing protein n=1 Tax=Botryobasidium botryosum (strain FD-172 SS1) TaxID=930990 RepID=A0A067MIQ4_BOTB1|nr:hypothetical protein BOTBODRAFT_158220 [Botryobasidium botryosum FD-172 SS1]